MLYKLYCKEEVNKKEKIIKNKLYTELCIITPVLTYIWGGFVLLLLVCMGKYEKMGWDIYIKQYRK